MRALDGIDHARKTRGLYANHFNVGLEGLGCCGNAGNQPATSHGNHQGFQFGHSLKHFQPYGTLASHDGFVVIGVNKNQPFAFCQQQRMGVCLRKRFTVQHHFSAKAPGTFSFDTCRKTRHDNHRANPQTLRMICNALCMVSRAHGHHASLLFTSRKLNQFVTSTTLFKGGGVLQIFKFQVNLCPGQLRQHARLHAGRVQQMAMQTPGSLFDVGQAEQVIPLGT